MIIIFPQASQKRIMRMLSHMMTAMNGKNSRAAGQGAMMNITRPNRAPAPIVSRGKTRFFSATSLLGT